MGLKFGLIGGGSISHKHIKAAGANGRARLIAGCFSRSADKNAAFAAQYGVSPDRAYPDYIIMAEAESKRFDRLDFIIVATPNTSHYDICKLFLERGFNVVCDKPLATDAFKAEELSALAAAKGLTCMTTYTFLGSKGIHALKSLYENGRVGKAYYIYLRYLRGVRLGQVMEDPRSVWRFNADLSGRAGAIGDLGSHLESLARFVTGDPIESVIARLVNEPNGIELDSAATVIFKTKSGLNGSMQIAQLACGYENEVTLELWCERGSLSWSFSDPESVWISLSNGGREKVSAAEYRDSIDLADPPVEDGTDGHITCFQRLYDGYITVLEAGSGGVARAFFPTFGDGAEGVSFIGSCVDSQRNNNAWTQLHL